MMKNKVGKTALVTGATSGIGEATATLLAENGWDVIVTGRRAERLKALKSDLKRFGVDVLTLALDVRDRQAVEASLGTLPERWRAIDLLVNNAGLGLGLEHLDAGDAADWETMVDTNVKGLLYVTRIVAGLMIEARRGGHIVNLGSIAGRQVYENGAVYCATKHAVNALSQGMRIDFLRHGIRVTEVRPGMVETEFSVVRFHGDEERAAAVYNGVEALTATDVAQAVVWAAGRPVHVNIDEIVITPRQQAGAYYVDRR